MTLSSNDFEDWINIYPDAYGDLVKIINKNIINENIINELHRSEIHSNSTKNRRAYIPLINNS